MLQVNVSINGHTQVLQVLQGMRERMGNMRPVMRNIGQHIVELAQHSIKTETSPYGQPYAPMSIATRLARARKQFGEKGLYTKGKKDGSGKRTRYGVLNAVQDAKLLRDTGLLFSGIKIIGNTESSVTVGIDTAGPKKYAPVQQFGGGKSRIPARPFLPLSGLPQESVDYIHDRLVRHINAAS